MRIRSALSLVAVAVAVALVVAGWLAAAARRGHADAAVAAAAPTRTVERVSHGTRLGRWSKTRVEERVEIGADGVERVVERHAMVADHLVVAFRAGTDPDAVARVAAAHGATVRERLDAATGDLWLLAFDATQDATLHRLERELCADPAVAYAEPDPLVEVCSTPDDPSLGKLWDLANTGQTGGTAGADIHAEGAWSLCTGSSSVKIAIIDTGVNFNHADLKANIWFNTGETGIDAQGRDKRTNGIDDDGDGYVDDWRGWDFVNDDNDPTDDHGHGTHKNGVAGACGDNAVGVTGVCWHVSLMQCKFIAADGTAPISAAIESLNYAAKHGARVASMSWGTGTDSQAFHDAVVAAGQHGMLLCVAAGNANTDIDTHPFYPSTWQLPNVLSVMATDDKDQKASFSCWGAKTIQIAAPGVDIYSTTKDGNYGSTSGTSSAVPHVSGAIALLEAYRPDLDSASVRARVLAAVDQVPALAGKCQSSGRLNLTKLLTAAKPTQPPPPTTAKLRIDVDDRYDLLYVDGAAQTLGHDAAVWNVADTLTVAGNPGVIALRGVNNVPNTTWGGLCAKLTLADGTTRVSDASWRVWTGAGAPPDDAAGRHWYQGGYDDAAWKTAIEHGAFGISPWGAPASLAGLEGARWIWSGDAAHAVSPVYFRWDLAGPPASEDVVWVDADDMVQLLYLNGVEQRTGVHTADWKNADRYVTSAPLECIALRATNAVPATTPAGLLATIALRDGSTVVSDGAWKCWSNWTPPNDSAGHAWTDPAYDDHAWTAVTVGAGYGAAPWGTQPGLSMMGGARWIWKGDLAKGISPVWFRRTFAPASTASR